MAALRGAPGPGLGGGGFLYGELRYLLHHSSPVAEVVSRLSDGLFVQEVTVHSGDLHQVKEQLPLPLPGLPYKGVEDRQLVSNIYSVHAVVVRVDHCRFADSRPSSCGDGDWLCRTAAAQHNQRLFFSSQLATQAPAACHHEKLAFHRWARRAVFHGSQMVNPFCSSSPSSESCLLGQQCIGQWNACVVSTCKIEKIIVHVLYT